MHSQSSYGPNASLPGQEPRPSSEGASGQQGGSNKWMGCLLGFFGAVTVLVLLGGALIIVFVVLIISAARMETAPRVGLTLQEVTVGGRPGQPKVAVVPLTGLLVGGGRPERDPLVLLQSKLDRARRDREVRGIILAVDSGGGSITTCDIMRRAIMDYRNATGNPVVVLMGSVAASGAYYVSTAADYIMAHPTSITGSIGVMFPLYDASELLDKIGLEDRTIKSDEYKDLTSPFPQRTPEEQERQQEILDQIVQQMHEQFVTVVARGRNLDPEAVRKLADGRIFSSRDAERYKLIDSVGYHDDAVLRVRELADLEQVHVVRYRRSATLRDLLWGRAGGQEVTLRLEHIPGLTHRKPMYLWDPTAH